MELLADESCAGPVIRALRAAGHDVVAVAEVAKGASDEWVIQQALSADRVLITEDRDFGELVYSAHHATAGVLFVKFHSRAGGAKPAAVADAIAKLGTRLKGRFAVVEPGRVRTAKRP